MTLFTRPLLVIDTETTGFQSDPHAVPWEIGAVRYDLDGSEVATFSETGCPDMLTSRMDEALRIGGMTREDIQALPPIWEAAEHFSAWAARFDASWSAFNVAFDSVMLERLRIAPLRWAPCIMERAKPIMGEAGALPWFNKYNDWKMPKLSEAATFFNVAQQEPAHRALADARTAGLIAIELQRRAMSAKNRPR